jgi:hypothetical protein
MKGKKIELVLYIIFFSSSLSLLEESKPDFSYLNSINEENEGNEKIKLINISLGRNQLNIEENKTYNLNFNNISNLKEELKNKDLLIYTDLYEVQNKISQFELIDEKNFSEGIKTFNATAKKNCFLDAKLVNKSLYKINKNITREEFYNQTIKMIKFEEKAQYYINIIPTDNNSDLYFFQTNKSSVRDDNKNRFKLYYLNELENKTLEQIISDSISKSMKRERCINGKLEIFGYSYKDLDKDVSISIGYKQIKGTGILGPIISLSVLFVALIIIIAIFIKNTYYNTNKRRYRDTTSEED